LAQLERRPARRGCRDALVVWKGENILLDGHNRLSICRQHEIPFRIEAVAFADRDAAEAYIVKHQLGRRNLSPEAAAYLRGKRYLAERQPNGGLRLARAHSEHVRTAQRLAEEYKVGAATIRRDGKFCVG